MNGLWQAGVWALTISLAFSALLVVTVMCADRRNQAAARHRHPTAPVLPSSVAIFCGSCGRPVRYQIHPEGRRDAVRLHQAFECDPSSHPIRRNVQK